MTDDRPNDYPSHDPLGEDAAIWFSRMRGEDANEHRPAFERWLAQGALHRAAYNRIGAIFAAGKALRPGYQARARSIGRWAPVAAAVAASVLASAAILLVSTWRPPSSDDAMTPRFEEALSTGQASVRSVRLPRGGTAILDADARLALDTAGTGRWLRLERGRIRIAVDPLLSPRTVLAGSFAIRSTGGVFDLWLRSDDSLDARVLDGRVRIRPAVLFTVAGDAPALTLIAGQHYRLRANGGAFVVPSTSGLDWPSGVLEYRGALLTDIVEEANRYSATKIMLADPALGTRRISGRFGVDDPEMLAVRLAGALALLVDRTQPGLLILRAKNISSAP